MSEMLTAKRMAVKHAPPTIAEGDVRNSLMRRATSSNEAQAVAIGHSTARRLPTDFRTSSPRSLEGGRPTGNAGHNASHLPGRSSPSIHLVDLRAELAVQDVHDVVQLGE